MSFGVQLTQDTASPDLAQLARAAGDMRPLFKAIGVSVVSIGKRAFNEATLRPNAWPAKKDHTAATLKDTTTLWRSVRVVNATSKSVIVGSDRKYAAIHQLGGRQRPIPRRGYLPFQADGSPTPHADKTIRQTIDDYIRARGGSGPHVAA